MLFHRIAARNPELADLLADFVSMDYTLEWLRMARMLGEIIDEVLADFGLAQAA